MKKIVIAIFASIVSIVFMLSLAGCNRTVFDTTYNFTYAYVELPTGEIVEGEVESWHDYADGDQLQVTFKSGKTYLTNSTRMVLVSD